MKITIGDFYWNYKRYQATEQSVKDAVEILNQLTPEQIEAVRMYGQSCREDGYDAGRDEN